MIAVGARVGLGIDSVGRENKCAPEGAGNTRRDDLQDHQSHHRPEGPPLLSILPPATDTLDQAR